MLLLSPLPRLSLVAQESNLARRNAGVLASVARTRADLLRLLAIVVALELDADLLGAGGAGVADGRSVTVVGVDASEHLSARRLDVLDGHRALCAISGTVST